MLFVRSFQAALQCFSSEKLRLTGARRLSASPAGEQQSLDADGRPPRPQAQAHLLTPVMGFSLQLVKVFLFLAALALEFIHPVIHPSCVFEHLPRAGGGCSGQGPRPRGGDTTSPPDSVRRTAPRAVKSRCRSSKILWQEDLRRVGMGGGSPRT